jgi:uncharacterized membrane protein (DUF106 family)
MKVRRPFLILWVAIVTILLVVEIAEVTQLFTLPIDSVVGNPIAFVFVLAFTTVLALVGAIFIGLYIAQRWLTAGDFTPFELEMLKMRDQLKELQRAVDQVKQRTDPESPDAPPEPLKEEERR